MCNLLRLQPLETPPADGTITQTRDVHEQLDSELTYLSTLSEEELDNELQSLEHQDGLTTRVAPVVIVGAIGCAVGIGGAVFTKSWEDSNSAVWALAGVLAGCIPGAQQAKLCTVIGINKHMIATALNGWRIQPGRRYPWGVHHSCSDCP